MVWPDEAAGPVPSIRRSEEHTSELQSRVDLVCRLLLGKKKKARRPGGACPAAPAPGPRVFPTLAATDGTQRAYGAYELPQPPAALLSLTGCSDHRDRWQ